MRLQVEMRTCVPWEQVEDTSEKACTICHAVSHCYLDVSVFNRLLLNSWCMCASASVVVCQRPKNGVGVNVRIVGCIFGGNEMAFLCLVGFATVHKESCNWLHVGLGIGSL